MIIVITGHFSLSNIVLPSGTSCIFMNVHSKLNVLKLQQFLKLFYFEMIIDLEKVAEIIQTGPMCPQPVSNCNILYNYRTSKPGNWCLCNPQNLFRLLLFVYVCCICVFLYNVITKIHVATTVKIQNCSVSIEIFLLLPFNNHIYSFPLFCL